MWGGLWCDRFNLCYIITQIITLINRKNNPSSGQSREKTAKNAGVRQTFKCTGPAKICLRML